MCLSLIENRPFNCLIIQRVLQCGESGILEGPQLGVNVRTLVQTGNKQLIPPVDEPFQFSPPGIETLL